MREMAMGVVRALSANFEGKDFELLFLSFIK